MSAAVILRRPLRSEARNSIELDPEVARPVPPITIVIPLGGVVEPPPKTELGSYQRITEANICEKRDEGRVILDASAVVEAKLRRVCPVLMDRVGPSGANRLRDIVLSRIAALIDRSIRSFRSRIGHVASKLDLSQRTRVQDLALTQRPREDALVAAIATELSSSEILGLLATSQRCAEEDWPLQSETFGVPEREARLDLLQWDLQGTPHPLFEDIIGRQMLDAVLAETDMTASAREALRAGFNDAALAFTSKRSVTVTPEH